MNQYSNTEYVQQVTQNGQMREKILGRGRTKTVPLVIPKQKQFKLTSSMVGALIRKGNGGRGFQINFGISYTGYRMSKLEPSSK